MEQRDYLMRQIQQMMQALIAVIRRLTGLKEEVTEEEFREITDQFLKEQLGASMDAIIEIPINEIVEKILQPRGVHPSNTELFVDLLLINARRMTDNKIKKGILSRCLELLEWSDRTSGVYSVDRKQKMEEIRSLLEPL